MMGIKFYRKFIISLRHLPRRLKLFGEHHKLEDGVKGTLVLNEKTHKTCTLVRRIEKAKVFKWFWKAGLEYFISVAWLSHPENKGKWPNHHHLWCCKPSSGLSSSPSSQSLVYGLFPSWVNSQPPFVILHVFNPPCSVPPP